MRGPSTRDWPSQRATGRCSSISFDPNYKQQGWQEPGYRPFVASSTRSLISDPTPDPTPDPAADASPDASSIGDEIGGSRRGYSAPGGCGDGDGDGDGDEGMAPGIGDARRGEGRNGTGEILPEVTGVVGMDGESGATDIVGEVGEVGKSPKSQASFQCWKKEDTRNRAAVKGGPVVRLGLGGQGGAAMLATAHYRTPSPRFSPSRSPRATDLALVLALAQLDPVNSHPEDRNKRFTVSTPFK